MNPFWSQARRMLDRPGIAVLALVMAFVSAAGLGVGLLGLVPVLNNIGLGNQANEKDLPALAAELNVKLAAKSFAGISLPVIPQNWIDALPTGAFNAVLWIVVSLGVLTIFGATANFLHEYLSLTIATRTVANLRRSAFHRVLHMPLGSVVRGNSSDLISRIINDTGILQRGFQQLTSKAVAQVTKSIASLAAAFVLSWRLTLITVVIAPVLAMILRKLGKRITRASKSQMKSQARLWETAGEAVRGFRVVKVFASERYEIGRFTVANAELMRESLRARTARAISSPLVDTIAIIVVGGLALVAAKAIISHQLEPSTFFGVLGSLAVCGASLKPLTGILQDIQTARAAAERLQQVLEAPVEATRETSKPRLARHCEALDLLDVSFKYPGSDQPAIENVTLHFPHGERVAIVGPNGCGKTTLLSLLPRLYEPDSGKVLIDGNDVSRVSLRSLRRQFGVVTQETVLFRGTVLANIAYAMPLNDPSIRARVEEAAIKAHAHEFITRLPQGYDTPVGEQGLTLSGGQRQRIAIARAILRDPAILIMDEATSMIDTESESMIARAIADFGRARTCLIVAHRLSTVMNADRIVVMDKGRILDQGRHAELLERCDLYRGLAGTRLIATGTAD